MGGDKLRGLSVGGLAEQGQILCSRGLGVGAHCDYLIT